MGDNDRGLDGYVPSNPQMLETVAVRLDELHDAKLPGQETILLNVDNDLSVLINLPPAFRSQPLVVMDTIISKLTASRKLVQEQLQ